MDTKTCEICGKECKGDRALKTHMTRMHSEKKVGADPKPTKKSKGKSKGTKKATLACDVCGKTFGMAAHLARHKSAAHGEATKVKKGRKVARAVKVAKTAKPIRRQAALAVPTSVDVRALSVDQLLSLKAEVDARLADIVKQMRAAKVAL